MKGYAEVCPTGYWWVMQNGKPSESGSGILLLEKPPTTGVQLPPRKYDPMEGNTPRSILRDFRGLYQHLYVYEHGKPEFSDKVIEFANKYGLLGLEILWPILPDTDDLPDGEIAKGGSAEPMEAWEEEVYTLEYLSTVMCLLNNPSDEATDLLRGMIGYSEGFPVFKVERTTRYEGPPLGSEGWADAHDAWKASQVTPYGMRRYGLPPYRDWDFDRDKLPIEFDDAWIWYGPSNHPSDKSNIRQIASQLLVANVNRSLARTVRVVTTLMKGSAMKIEPSSLLGAIYLQFSIDTVGNEAIREVRVCKRPGCSNHLETNHRARLYCSDRCRDLHKKQIKRSAGKG